MAMNVWNSRGAGRRSRTLGLGQLEIIVPTADDVAALSERMSHFGIEARDDGQTVSLDDPWGNLILVSGAR
jgi:catechol 2,3-dioxygenase